jgi:hypothetical protein
MSLSSPAEAIWSRRCASSVGCSALLLPFGLAMGHQPQATAATPPRRPGWRRANEVRDSFDRSLSTNGPRTARRYGGCEWSRVGPCSAGQKWVVDMVGVESVSAGQGSRPEDAAHVAVGSLRWVPAIGTPTAQHRNARGPETAVSRIHSPGRATRCPATAPR